MSTAGILFERSRGLKHALRQRIKRLGLAGKAPRHRAVAFTGFETLEPRVLLSTVTWTGNAGDNLWSDAANWSPSGVPATGSDVVIPSTTGNPTINFTSAVGTDNVNSVTSADPINLSGGTLQVATTVTMNGQNLTLAGGTLQGATVDTSGGAELVGTGSGGNLIGVTLNGNLDLSQSQDARVNVEGNLTLNGTALIGSASGFNYAYLYFGNDTAAASSLTGSAVVLFGDYTDQLVNESTGSGAAGTLTLGSGVVIHGASGTVANANSTGTIVNQGTINADTTGGTIIFGNSTGTLTNSGTLEATAGTLDLGGTFTLAQLGTFAASGGTVNLTGTLTNTGTTLDLTATTGTLTLAGGTINGGTVDESGGAELLATPSGGNLVGVTLNGNLDLSQSQDASVNVEGNLTLNGTALIDSASGFNYAYLYFGNDTAAASSLTGSAVVLFGDYTDQLVNESTGSGAAGTLTLGSGVVIHGASGTVANANSTGTIVNQGTINADTTGGTIIFGNSTGTLTNSGTLEATAGTLDLGGTFTLAQLGTFAASGGTVNLTGTLTNTGTTLDLTATTGTLTLAGGTINGGTVDESGGAELLATPSGGNLVGVTLNGNLDLSQSQDASVNVEGNLTLNGTALIDSASGFNYAYLYFGNDTAAASSLTGSAVVLFGDYTDQLVNESTGSGAAGTLTLGSGVVIHGASGTVANANSTGTIVNQGTINADTTGGTIIFGNSTGVLTNTGTLEATAGTLDLGGAWSNTGTLSVSGTATLDLGGSFTTAGIGTLSNTGGTVNLTGTLNNTGTALNLNATTGSWDLSPGGTIQGGTVTASGGAGLTATGGTLAGVTLDANLTVNNDTSVSVTGGLTLNATLTLDCAGTYTTAVFSGSQTLAGTGQVVFEGTYAYARIYAQGGGTLATAAVLTIGPDITIDGTEGGLISTTYSYDSITNQGTIDADAAGQTITISGGTLTNSGTLEATNGGSLAVNGLTGNIGIVTLSGSGSTLTLGGTNYVNNLGLTVGTGQTLNLGGAFTTADVGTVTNTGGTVNLTGTLNNTGTTLNLNATTGSWDLSPGGTIQGGTVTASGGAGLTATGGTLAGVTLDANLTVNNDTSVSVTGGLTLNATLTLDCTGTYSTAVFSGSQTLAGTGQVVFEGTYAYARIYAQGGGTLATAAVLTIGPDITIDGTEGGLISTTYSYDSITNQGTIDADAAGQTITISGGTLTNSGTLAAANGGSLSISDLTGNVGTATLSGTGSALTLGGTGYVNNLGLAAPAGTKLTLNGTWSNPTIISLNSATLNLGGTFTVANLGAYTSTNGTVNLTGTLTNTGTTLNLNATTGSWNLSPGGTIQGGTVTASGGAGLTATGGTLAGVTLDANLTVNNDTSVSVTGGLTLNATLTLDCAGSPTSVVFSGSQTLAGTGQVVFGGTYAYARIYAQGGGTLATAAVLTIGPDITIDGTEGGLISTTYSYDSITNQGTIDADAAGQTITISGGTLTNSGTLEATNGGGLSISNLQSITGQGALAGSGTGTLAISNSVLGNTTNATGFNPLETVLLDGSGTAAAPQLLEAMSADQGEVASAYLNNFAYGALDVGPSNYVQLTDQNHNSSGTGSEAVYAVSVSVPAGSTLDLHGLHLYAGAANIQGTVLNGSISLAPLPPSAVVVAGNGILIPNNSTSTSLAAGTNYGSVPENTAPVDETFTIANNGIATLTIGSVTVPAGLSVVSAPPAAITAHAWATFTVQLATTTVGTFSGNVSFSTSDQANTTFIFAITGTVAYAEPLVAVNYGGVPVVNGESSPSPTNGTNFGDLPQGALPVVGTFTIVNSGNANLTLSPVSGSSNVVNLPAGFSLMSAPATTVAPGQTTTLTIGLPTTGVGTFTGNVRFATNDPNNPTYTFEITGTIAAIAVPNAVVTGNGVVVTNGATTTSAANGTSFGTVAQGATPVVNTFTITNTGSSLLTITTVPGSGSVSLPAGFSLVTAPAATVAPGASTSFEVGLPSSTMGTYSGNVSFASNDPNNPTYTFAITGTIGAVAAPAIVLTGNGNHIVNWESNPGTSNATSFGSVAQGAATMDEVYTINNTGNATLTVGTVSVPGGFTLVSAPTSPVAAGGTTSFTVGLLTSNTGTFSGNVSFATNDPNNPTFVFDITGTVTSALPPLVISNPTVDQEAKSITMPSGATTYIYGQVAGGGAPTNPLVNGSTETLNDGAGYLSAGLAVSTSPTNSFTTSAAAYAISGVGVSGYSSMTVQYGTWVDSGSGTVSSGSYSTSVSFTLSQSSLVVAMGLASSQETIAFSGISALITDTAPANAEVLAGIAHAYLVPGSYTLTETATVTTAQAQNHMADLLGVYIFAGAPQGVVAVTGNAQPIANGESAPSTANGTGFGSVAAGTPTVDETYTIANNGNTALTLGTVALPSGFTLVSAPTSPVSPGTNTTFTVGMPTSTLGTFSGNVTFTTNDPNNATFNFAITGTVASPAAAVSGNGNAIANGENAPSPTNTTNFGAVAEDAATLDETYTITDTGNAALTVGTVTAPTGFTLVSAPATTVAAGGQTTFTVGLTTTSVGTFTGNVSFATTDPGNPTFTFEITGTVNGATASVTGNANPIANGENAPSTGNATDFGSVSQGAPTADETYTIANSGNIALTVGTVSVPAGFTLVSAPSGSVGTGGTTTFTVGLTTGTAGLFSGNVSFATNDPNDLTYKFEITGTVTGTGPVMSNPTVTAGAKSISLPSGATTYLYGQVAGGGATTSALANSSVKTLNDAAGYLADGLGVSTSATNSFTTSAAYYAISGVGVSGYTTMTTEPYGTWVNTGSGSVRSGTFTTSSTFTLTQPALVVALDLASSQQTIAIALTSGTGTLTTDAAPSNAEVLAGIAHGTLAAGTYTITLTTTVTTSQAQNHMADLLGVYAFTGAATPEPIAAVTGNGNPIADGAATPASSNDTLFPAVTQGAATEDETYTIANTGTAALTVGTVSVPSGFTLVTAPASTVAAGSNTTFTVGLQTTSVGTPSGNVSFTTNDPNNLNYTFVVTGTVTVPGAYVVTSLADVASTSPNYSGTLRWAIQQANNDPGTSLDPDAITFASDLSGTITLTQGQLELTGGYTTIQGPGASTVTVNGDDLSRVFQVDASATATISGLTIAGGGVTDSNGGGINNAGTLTLNNSTLSGDTAAYDGSGSDLAYGGGIYNAGTLTLNNSTLSGDTAYGGGGGIYNSTGATLTAANSTLSGDSASYLNFGGGLYNDDGTVTLTNSTLSGDSAGAGGGITTYEGTLTLTSDTLSDDTTTASSGTAGGGMFNNYGTITITNSTLSGDTSPNGTGGAIYNYDSTNLTLINDTLSGNSAKSGGGIFNLGTLTVTNSTITDNSAGTGGGIYNNGGGSATVNNTIVATNTLSNGTTPSDIYGALVASSSYNLIGDGSGGLVNGTGGASGNILTISDATIATTLGVLANNGGPTQTMALLTGSPAINAGGNSLVPAGVTADQRGAGYPRIVNGTVDIGAFEAEPTASVTGNGNPIADGSTTPASANDTLFPAVAQGAATEDETYTIANTGTAALTVGTVSVPSGFTLVTAPASTVAAGSNTTFTVGLQTTSVGTPSGNVSFTTSDPNNLTYTFAIAGTVTGTGPATSNPTVDQGSKSISLPTGATTYLYGEVAGGGATTSPLANGSTETLNDAAGYLAAGLGVSTLDTNSFTTGASYYAISGVGVSGYSNMTAQYGTYVNTSSGTISSGTFSTSVTFTLTQSALVVAMGLGSTQETIAFSGVTGLVTDVAPANAEVLAGIAHVSLGAGTYTLTETTTVTTTQNQQHMADLLGVYIFTGSDPALVSGGTVTPRPAGEIANNDLTASVTPAFTPASGPTLALATVRSKLGDQDGNLSLQRFDSPFEQQVPDVPPWNKDQAPSSLAKYARMVLRPVELVG